MLTGVPGLEELSAVGGSVGPGGPVPRPSRRTAFTTSWAMDAMNPSQSTVNNPPAAISPIPSMARPGVGYRDETKQAWVCKECGEAHTLFTTELEYEQEQRARVAHRPLPIVLAAGGLSPQKRHPVLI